jgi:hypothetical protein
MAKKKTATKPATNPNRSACAKGGQHEWTEEDGEKFCAKCKEPAPTKKKVVRSPAKKLSALDAAAQVLAKAKQPMNCQALIQEMAGQGIWTSPGGKTPQATLYSAILREIHLKGKDSRFKKIDRGQFAANA